MKYSIGTKIGELTIISYDPAKCYYGFRCSCDKQFIGTTQSINQKLAQEKEFGTAACKSCLGKIKRSLLTDEELYRPIYKEYIRGAHKRDQREFKLTYSHCLKLFKNNCHYCNSKPSNVIKIGQRVITYQGIDRMEQNIGYLETNVVPCCKNCNYAKNILNYNEFIDLITRIYNNVQRPEQTLVDPSGPKWKEPELEIEGYDMV